MNGIQEVTWTQIPLQVDSELRIENNGDLTLGNQQLELAGDTSAADAVLLYASIRGRASTSYACWIQ